jgi:hypothetical protein
MRRHTFDPLSAALGIIAVVLGVLVASGRLDELGSATGAWVTGGVLLAGLGVLPWSRRRDRRAPTDGGDPPAADPPAI